MDDRGALRGGHAAAEGPGADFLLAGGEVGRQAEQVIGAADERGYAGVGDAEGLEELGGFGRRQVAEFGFDLGADHDVLAAVAFADERRDGRDVGVLGGIGEIAFGDVASEEHLLGGKQVVGLEAVALVVADFQGGSGEILVEVLHEAGEQLDVGDGVLVLAADLLLVAVKLLFGGLDVGQDEFGLDDLDVADGVDLAHAVDDVVVVEAADHVDDGVALADVGEEVVALAFALGGAGDEAGDVDDVDRGRDDDLRAGDDLQLLHAVVGHEDHADVGLDRAERVVGRFGLTRAREGVEEGRLAHVGESDDACLGLCHGRGNVGIRPVEVKSRRQGVSAWACSASSGSGKTTSSLGCG